MKKLLVLVAMLVFVVSFAYAEETSPANWDNNLGSLGNYLRDKADGHTHDYTDNDTITRPDQNYEYGVGIDVIIYESDPNRTKAKKLLPDAVEVQNKYDFGNQNFSTYVVAKYNLWKAIKKEK